MSLVWMRYVTHVISGKRGLMSHIRLSGIYEGVITKIAQNKQICPPILQESSRVEAQSSGRLADDYGVATMSRRLKIIGLFGKRAL